MHPWRDMRFENARIYIYIYADRQSVYWFSVFVALMVFSLIGMWKHMYIYIQACERECFGHLPLVHMHILLNSIILPSLTHS